ncbi:amidohydrolase [Alicyclobacillus hesperidum URH17-3-68]|nr:amidohydrolase [Alicyclobacillus hesperidum URH17-3-68]
MKTYDDLSIIKFWMNFDKVSVGMTHSRQCEGQITQEPAIAHPGSPMHTCAADVHMNLQLSWRDPFGHNRLANPPAITAGQLCVMVLLADAHMYASST